MPYKMALRPFIPIQLSFGMSQITKNIEMIVCYRIVDDVAEEESQHMYFE